MKSYLNLIIECYICLFKLLIFSEGTSLPRVACDAGKSYFEEFLAMTCLFVITLIIAILLAWMIYYNVQNNKDPDEGDDVDGQSNGHANGGNFKIPFRHKLTFQRTGSKRGLLKKNKMYPNKVYQPTVAELTDMKSNEDGPPCPV